jgi:uncharacterized protein YdeI (YjbR/CyaY-like superfamily)
MTRPERQKRHFTTRDELRSWLTEHSHSCPGIWLVSSRSGEDGAAPTYDEVVEEALCFGWIDSTVRRRDDRTNAMLLTPRRPAQPRRGRTRRGVERLTPPGS